jgi:probable selenium-dependent hydroxylase accessory protein YqeC
MPGLLDVLSTLPPARGYPPLLALCGGGGKTAALFALADELAVRGSRVLVTTTTRIRDPRTEGRGIDGFLEIPRPGAAAAGDGCPADRGSVTVLCAGVENGKLVGLDPGIFPDLAASGRWDAILVEADGAKMRPVKAPAPYEPVWPAGVTAALGVIGLDCLGRPLDDRIAHRPEVLGPLVGLDPGGILELGHLARLARHPQGLFRGAPGGARRILVLNKADQRPDLDPGTLAAEAAAGLAGPGPAALRLDSGTPKVDLVLVCSLADPDPGRRVRAAVFRDGVPAVY